MNDEEEKSAVLGVTKTCRTHVDGSIVFQIEVEPRHAQAAFALFGAPGTPVAVARIMPEVVIRDDRQATETALRGGELAKLAGQFCDSEPFRQWLRLTYDPKPRNSAEAAQIIRGVCGVDSRAHLDHVEVAAQIFHDKFRLPFNAWLKGGMK